MFHASIYHVFDTTVLSHSHDTLPFLASPASDNRLFLKYEALERPSPFSRVRFLGCRETRRQYFARRGDMVDRATPLRRDGQL